MAELRPIPLAQLLRRIALEPARTGALFDLPLRKAWRPSGKVDLSVAVHGHRAQTPVGPAAGPHAQLAQNIVLSWLGGARVIELKTVQVLDALTIGRPCIDAATVGFNVEWSQELRLAESLREYVAGWMLLRILRELDPLGLGPEVARAAEPIFELSVGYDLAGLQSQAMRDYLLRVRDVTPIIDELRREIADPRLRDLDYRSDMISCVTLSTFHGCPAPEIEAIARYLLVDHDFDVIVKLNPTLLGFDEVTHLLHDRLGYRELRPKRAAFDGDLQFDDAIRMARRLSLEAAARGRTFGVKMVNTLVVENHKRFFREPEMYLSGPPLHVLAMRCVERWREALGSAVPLSFSGGIDQHNFADAVACDLVPVTTCTDLLRQGGYGRLPRYLENLEQAMLTVGARDRDELVLRRFGKGAEAVHAVLREVGPRGSEAERATPSNQLAEKLCVALRQPGTTLAEALDATSADGDEGARSPIFHDPIGADLHRRIVAAAGLLNAREVAARVLADPRYAAPRNAKPPRKVGSTLVLFDCLSCDKCVPVCPNDANFAIATPLEEVAWEDLVLDGGEIAREPGGTFRVSRTEQWANFADACNECGNCDIFCPEDGGPYIMKARFFGSLASFEASPSLDGLVVDEQAGALRVRARLSGRRYELTVPADGTPAALDDGRLRVAYDPHSAAIVSTRAVADGPLPHRLSGGVFLTLRALVRGVLDPRRLNPVSAATAGLSWPSPSSTPSPPGPSDLT